MNLTEEIKNKKAELLELEKEVLEINNGLKKACKEKIIKLINSSISGQFRKDLIDIDIMFRVLTEQ